MDALMFDDWGGFDEDAAAEYAGEAWQDQLAKLADTFRSRRSRRGRRANNLRELEKRSHDRRKRWGCRRGPGSVCKVAFAFTAMSS